MLFKQLCFNNNRLNSFDLLICFFLYYYYNFFFFCGGGVCFVKRFLGVFSNLAIILLRKRYVIDLLLWLSVFCVFSSR